MNADPAERVAELLERYTRDEIALAYLMASHRGDDNAGMLANAITASIGLRPIRGKSGPRLGY